VGFHLEDDALAGVTKRHNACAFECIGILCLLELTKCPEGVSGVLIGAVLTPFNRKHIELEVGRDTPQTLYYEVIFAGPEAELHSDIDIDCRICGVVYGNGAG
jgi:hypothetical protein